MQLEELRKQRISKWRQDGKAKVVTSAIARELIEELGLCTLYPASPEFPSILLAYLGSTSYEPNPSWDSPGGHVYGWRWELGRPAAAFYSSIVARKPTYVAWRLLPTVLAASMTRDDPKKLYEQGQLGRDALKVYQALETAKAPLKTGDLRDAAGFPKGKEHRAAYLKAVAELEDRLLLAKLFDEQSEGDDMSHGLVKLRYTQAYRQALDQTPLEGIRDLIINHLKASVYIDAAAFSRHLRLQLSEVIDILSSLEQQGMATCIQPGSKPIYAVTATTGEGK